VGQRLKWRRRREDAAGLYVQGLVVKDDEGLDELHVCVGAQSAERLAAGLRAGFEQTLERHLGSQAFSGRIELVILSEITPQTADVRETVQRVESELRARLESSRLKTATGRPVRVGLRHTTAERPA
jgi:hypothetical protein